jgi:Ca2+-binding RTX toxin-like protein
MTIRNVPGTYPTIAAAVAASAAGDSVVIDAGYAGNETVQVTVDALTFGAPATVGGIVLKAAAGVTTISLAGVSAFEVIGNDAANVLNGNDGDNILEGGPGGDQLNGGAGFDLVSYVGSSINVGVFLGTNSGLGGDAHGDTYSSIEGAIGTAFNDFLHGGDTANLLRGGAGDDRISGIGGDDILRGEAGNDTLLGDPGSDDLDGGAGVDTLSYTFNGGFAVKVNLATGTAQDGNGTDTISGFEIVEGTGRDDILIGSAFADTLNGSDGADRMEGGSGNDTYRVDNIGDRVIERAGGGTDLVISTAETFTLAAFIEDLWLEGGLVGIGNGLANVLTGNVHGNTLNGAGGADRMIGGDGDDVYVVDNAADIVVERGAQGTDRVQSSATHVLADNVENLTLTGGGNVAGTGNVLANTLAGNGGSNTIDGRGGNDTLTGGAAKDIFAFTTGLNAAKNVDTLTDFVSGVDKFGLDDAVFSALAAGRLAATAFVQASAATTSAHRIIYNAATGVVSYDADGVGGVAAVAFAKLSPGQAFAAQDFRVA